MAIKKQLKDKWSKPKLVVLIRKEDSLGSGIWEGACKNSSQSGASGSNSQCFSNSRTEWICGVARCGWVTTCYTNCSAQVSS